MIDSISCSISMLSPPGCAAELKLKLKLPAATASQLLGQTSLAAATIVSVLQRARTCCVSDPGGVQHQLLAASRYLPAGLTGFANAGTPLCNKVANFTHLLGRCAVGRKADTAGGRRALLLLVLPALEFEQSPLLYSRHKLLPTCWGCEPWGTKQKLPAATALSGCGSKPCRSASRSAASTAEIAPRDSGVLRVTRSLSLCGGPAAKCSRVCD